MANEARSYGHRGTANLPTRHASFFIRPKQSKFLGVFQDKSALFVPEICACGEKYVSLQKKTGMTTDYRRQTIDNGQQTTDYGQLTTDIKTK